MEHVLKVTLIKKINNQNNKFKKGFLTAVKNIVSFTIEEPRYLSKL